MTTTTMADLTTGLVVQYYFNGNANDTSGNGHDGTVYGATPTTDRFGNPNSAFHFDGIDDYVNVPYHSDFQLPTYTVSAWIIVIRGEDFTSDHTAIYFGVSPPSSSLDNGTFLMYEDNSDNDFRFDTNYYPPTGSWTHLAATRSSSDDVGIYINGNLHSQWSSTPQPTTNCFQDLLIGAYWYSPTLGNQYLSGFFPGVIDDVAIYNRILTTDEIKELSIIPTPGAVVLGMIGIGCVNWLRRRRTL
jgi:hypothetical protein